MENINKLKCKTVKFLEENMWDNIHDFEFGDGVFDTTQKAWSMKEKRWTWASLKFIFCPEKRLLKNERTNHFLGKYTCKSHIQ